MPDPLTLDPLATMPPMTTDEFQLFEQSLDHVLTELPPQFHELFEQVPLIIEDHPSPTLVRELNLEYLDDLAGLHDGIPITQRSVEHEGTLPDTITIYREGLLSLSTNDDGSINPALLAEQIRITILHEVGHHFGLDEDDLEELGYQ